MEREKQTGRTRGKEKYTAAEGEEEARGRGEGKARPMTRGEGREGATAPPGMRGGGAAGHPCLWSGLGAARPAWGPRQ